MAAHGSYVVYVGHITQDVTARSLAMPWPARRTTPGPERAEAPQAGAGPVASSTLA